MSSLVPSKRDTPAVGLGKKRRRIFLDVLARTGRVAESARAAGFTDTSYLKKVRNGDPEFAAAWDAALEAAADMLEDEAVRRAVQGVRKAIMYKGQIVGYDLIYSDRLLMFLLKGARPDKFAERKKVDATVGGNIGIAMLPPMNRNEDDWEKSAGKLHAQQEIEKFRADDVIDAEFEDVGEEDELADLLGPSTVELVRR